MVAALPDRSVFSTKSKYFPKDWEEVFPSLSIIYSVLLDLGMVEVCGKETVKETEIGCRECPEGDAIKN
jgi:hypothetical protein